MAINNNTRFLGIDSTKVNLIEKKDSVNNSVAEYFTADEISGGGLEGTSYVYVAADGTDVENAVQLQNAYDTAQTTSPSAANRVKVICGPGNYNFSTDFVMDVQYIDLVSLDGNRSVIFNGLGTISITANDVFVKGVDVLLKIFTVANDLNLFKVENCAGGDFSFGGAVTAAGTFTNCIGGTASFGGSFPGGATGVFTDCVGGDASFASGSNRRASGTFTNCVGGSQSFGGAGGIALGTFTNCTAGPQSFGENGAASGTFTDCVGLDNCFGSEGVASGLFRNCVALNGSFGGSGTASGTFTDCQGLNGSFGGDEFGFGIANASGTFTNCVAAVYSFGGAGTASGTFTNCISASESFGGDGTASGTFTSCTGGLFSFGGLGTLSGQLYYCRLTGGAFELVSGAGVTRLCIDGSNLENNQG